MTVSKVTNAAGANDQLLYFTGSSLDLQNDHLVFITLPPGRRRRKQ